MEEKILEQIEIKVRKMKHYANKVLEVGLEVEQLLSRITSRPTKRALDGAKAPRKSRRSTGSPRK